MSPLTIEEALQLAIGHHQAGRLAEAEAVYRQILALQPNHAGALHLLGLIALQVGQHAFALELIGNAIRIQPDFPAAHLNLGNTLIAVRRYEDASAAFRRAIALQPNLPEAHNSLGAVLREQGRHDEAVAAYRQAIMHRPDYAEAHNNLAVELCEQGRPDEAEAACRRAMQIRPDYSGVHYNLGNALQRQGRNGEALAAFCHARELAPDDFLIHNAIGVLLKEDGQFDEAIATFRRGLECHPDSALIWNNLGSLFGDLGRISEAIPCTRRAGDLQPQSHWIFSSLLVMLQYASDVTARGLFDAHCEFDRIHAAPFRSVWPPHPNTPDAERPLRIGMVSPHFAFHPVGHFLIRVLENLDRARFEVIGYSDMKDADAMTARLRAAMAGWCETAGLSDEQLAARIREDRVDILFDLAGHTAGNRLLALARRPAPIQITWLDYVGTTGLSAMDYILGDPREIPPEHEPWYREKVLRMPDDYICYDPPADAPEVGPLPALATGRVTFASFNIPPKTTPEIVRVWARILGAVPGSRLILKNRAFDDPATRQRYGAIFAEAGIAPTRIEFRGWSPNRELLAAYNEADIALDTWPYNGGLTTCEALWMGVPVITCPGETFASRHGLAHLTAAGLPGTIARDLDHYVEIATALASDLPTLAASRAKMRAQVASSPLCDGRRFAGHFMANLRHVWHHWCANAPA